MTSEENSVVFIMTSITVHVSLIFNMKTHSEKLHVSLVWQLQIREEQKWCFENFDDFQFRYPLTFVELNYLCA